MYTRKDIIKPDGNTNYNKLLKELCVKIHELKIFREVGVRIREQESLACPSCILVPRRIVESERLTGLQYEVQYPVSIAFAVKGSDDGEVTQSILFFEKQIRTALSKNEDNTTPLVFSDVFGHFNTKVETGEIAPEQLVGNKVLIFSGGINVVFFVWETR